MRGKEKSYFQPVHDGAFLYRHVMDREYPSCPRLTHQSKFQWSEITLYCPRTVPITTMSESPRPPTPAMQIKQKKLSPAPQAVMSGMHDETNGCSPRSVPTLSRRRIAGIGPSSWARVGQVCLCVMSDMTLKEGKKSKESPLSLTCC